MSSETIIERSSPSRTRFPSVRRLEPGTWAAYVAGGLGTFGLVLAGCGTWTAQWVYLIAPLVGAVAGALLYRWMREAGKHSRSHTAQEEPHE